MRVSGREKTFLWGGAVLLAVLLVFQLAVYPAMKRNRELARLIPQRERDLKELRQLHQELDSLKAAGAAMIQKIPAEERSLPPLSRLDGWIERSGLRKNIRSIKPSPSPGGEGMVVEVMVEKAELPQVALFLYEVQSSSGGSRIARLDVKPRYTTPKYLDISLQLMFYRG